VTGLVALLSVQIVARAQDSESETTFEQEFKKTAEIIVMVKVEFSDESKVGAGIIFGREKERLLIATAYHVIHDNSKQSPVRVKLKSMTDYLLNATLLKYDATADLAVLSVEKPNINVCALPFDRLGDVTQLKRRDSVNAVGNPHGVSWAMPVDPDRVSEINAKEIVFQSNFISVGHSGGALLNEKAAVVGMILADQPPFGRAANIDAVIQLVKQWGFPVSLFTTLEKGMTPLHQAAKTGNVAAIKSLLSVCGDANGRDGNGAIPFHWAAWSGSMEAITILMKSKADLSIVDQDGDTPLHWAVWGKEIGSIRFLIKAGATVNAINNKKQTPLHLVVNQRPKRGQTDSEKTRWVEMISFLITAGGKLEAAALYDLLFNHEVEDAKILLKAVFDLNARITRDESLEYPGGTLLHLAVGEGEVEIVELLLKLGADVNSVTVLDETPLMIASRTDRKEIQNLLTAHGARMKK
jgi:ankyrin repeat protein